MKRPFLILIGLCISVLVLAQGVQYPVEKYILKRQYDKAYAKIEKQLHRDSTNVMYLYSGGVLYLQHKYADYSLQRSYDYACRAKQSYDLLSDKQVRQLLKKGLDDVAIQAQIDTIAYRDANLIKRHPTEAEYNRWLETYTQASGYIRKRMTMYRNSVAYIEADKQQTIAAYQAFIDRYPEAEEAELARMNILQIHYIEAERENTIEAFEKFIQMYPKSARVEDARAHIYALAYQQAVDQHQSSALLAFIRKYPAAPQRAAAEKLVSHVAYEEARTEHTPEAYETYAKTYPHTPEASEALCLAALLRRDVEGIETILPSSKGALRDSCVAVLHEHYCTLESIQKMQWLYRYYPTNLPDSVRAKYAAIAALTDSTDTETFIRTVAPYRAAFIRLKQEVDKLSPYSWQDALGLITLFEDDFGDDEVFWTYLEDVNLKAYKEAQEALRKAEAEAEQRQERQEDDFSAE